MGQNFLLPAILQEISLNILDLHNLLPLNEVYVGLEREIFLKNQISEFAEEIKLKCLDFYISAVEDMMKRLPFNDFILRELKFFNSKLTLYDETRSVIKDLTHIAIYFGNFDVTALAFEWRILPTIFSNAEKDILANLEIDNMWERIFEKKNFNDDRMFLNLEKLVHAILSLPHSNAEAERIFSIVTDVKNKKRNRMNIENLAICKIRFSFQAQNIDCHTFQVDTRHI